MGRSDLTHIDPAVTSVLVAAYDAVWGRVERLTTATNNAPVQDAISGALHDMAAAGELDPARLRAYALDRAHAALAGS
jgi:hypothetical protein